MNDKSKEQIIKDAAQAGININFLLPEHFEQDEKIAAHLLLTLDDLGFV